MKKLLLTLVGLFSVMSALAGSYTITFKSNTGDSDATSAISNISQIIESGRSYVSEVTATKIYNAKSGYGIKFSTSSANGSLEMKMVSVAQINVTSVVVNAAKYGKDASSLVVSVGETAAAAQTLETDFKDYTYTFEGVKATSIKLSATKRIYVKSITVNYEGDDIVLDDPKPAENVKVANISALIEANKDLKNNTTSESVFEFTNPVTAIYQNGQNLYVSDNSGYMLIFGSTTNTYKNGDVIPAGLAGNYKMHNGLPELILAPASLKPGTAGTAVEPLVGDVDDPAAEGLNSYVVFKDVTVTAGSGKNFTISQGSLSVAGYNTFNITIPEGDHLNVVGFVSYYNNVQILPVEITSATGQEVVASPKFSPAAGEVAAGTAVTVSSATEGASIHYTLDGSDPTASSTPYSEPIVINEAATIKAIAMKDGMANSGIAVAEYTIKAEMPNVAVFDFTQPATLNPALPKDKDAEGLAADGTNGNKQYVITGVNFTDGTVIVTNTKGSTTDAREYYLSGGEIQLRVYNGGSTTVSSADSENPITKIVFTYNNGSTSYNKVSVTDGTFDKGTWTGEALAVTFSYSGTQQIKTIEVTCKNGLKEMVATPVFSVASGEVAAGTTVGITTATEGASIYYTIDGTEPTASSTPYTTPITINETTTLKAIAVKEGMVNSIVATAGYEVFTYTAVNNVAETLSLEDNARAIVNYDLTVGFAIYGNVYACDAAGKFIQVYKKGANFGLKPGDVIPAGWKAIYTVFSGNTPELEPLDELPASTAGTFTPAVVEPSAITAGSVNSVVKIENVIFTEATPATKIEFTGKKGDAELTLRNNYTLASVEPGTYNVTVVVTLSSAGVNLNVTGYEFVSSDTSGIDAVGADNVAPVEYYNLQGMRVEHPATGLYIKRQGNAVSKVYIRN